MVTLEQRPQCWDMLTTAGDEEAVHHCQCPPDEAGIQL